jgi:hypothetical protein
MRETVGSTAAGSDVQVPVPDEGATGSATGVVPLQRGESSGPDDGRDSNLRSGRGRRPFDPLPDLAAGLSAVPGGLGVELFAPFSFAGVEWTAADAALDASPIAAHRLRLSVPRKVRHTVDGPSAAPSRQESTPLDSTVALVTTIGNRRSSADTRGLESSCSYRPADS